MALYSEKSKEFKEELFQNPTSEYREAPFWAWNCKLDIEELKQQITYLKKMGMGGFFSHSRTGMATEYLSEKFMELVKECDRTAEEEGMLCYLYDEDRWPSGAAGGIVTKEIRYRARSMVVSPCKLPGFEKNRQVFEEKAARHIPGEPSTLKGYVLGSFKINLQEGFLKDYVCSPTDELSGENVWYAYLQISEESPWYNGQTYLDTLNKQAVERFIEVTYENYYRHMGDKFGASIPAIFTDEPQFTRKDSLVSPDDRECVNFPYTDDFDQTFYQTYGYHILEKIPELVWNLTDSRVSQARYHYHDHVCERFVTAFSDTIGEWCKNHNIVFTGHVFWEDSLYLQTRAVGETMRFYRGFQLPGVDMLRDDHYFNTLKQCQSVAHQQACPGIMSELYGVTNWHFDFKGYKVQGDWQAALGVTFRVPHLSLVSMEGEAKRDFPSSFNYQSPWYEEYPLISDHFARLNTALTRGVPNVKIGIIHPIESYWLFWGVNTQNDAIRKGLDQQFSDLADWMLFGLLEYDYISESLLADEPDLGDHKPVFRVGAMAYDVIIVPGCVTLRSTTLHKLEEFQKKGGNVVFMGQIPSHLDALPSEEPKQLAKQCKTIAYTKYDLMEALQEYRFMDATLISRNLPDDYRVFYCDILPGARLNYLLHQERLDGNKMWVFLAHAYSQAQDTEWPDVANLSFNGNWEIHLYDTLSGKIKKMESTCQGGKTYLRMEIFKQDSFLFQLVPLQNADKSPEKQQEIHSVEKEKIYLSKPVNVRPQEPNVYLLDKAQWSFCEEDWQPLENILRIDTYIRNKLGWPVRSFKTVKQPWAMAEEELEKYPLKLRYVIHSETDCDAVLAIERPQDLTIVLNGNPVPSDNILGYYVDKSIKKLKIPGIAKGENYLELQMQYTNLTNLESLYLLGDFQVKLHGDEAVIIQGGDIPQIGDVTYQGYPFYSGNLVYEFTISVETDKSYELFLPRYEGHVVAVWLDGVKMGRIAFAPHKLDLGVVSKGDHKLEIVVYGNRFNTFGQVHLPDIKWTYWGPDSWRSHGSNWLQSYHVKPFGLVTYPELLSKE